jgi:hypothetical protein
VETIDLSRFLRVFRENYATASLFGGAQDQGIPERKSVKPVEIDSSQNIRDVWGGNVELGQQLDFTASDMRINVQFASDCNEIFLQDLQRYNAGSVAPVLGN